jgi:hypothetical protein
LVIDVKVNANKLNCNDDKEVRNGF